MANTFNPAIAAAAMRTGLSTTVASKVIPRFRIPESPTPTPAPTPTPTPALEPIPPAALPTAPAENPFDKLPFPSPGDRIRSDDFRTLSQALKIVSEMTSLSATLFGMSFGDAKSALLGHGFHLARVMSVFGTEITDLADASLDGRKVVQVVAAELGTHQLMVVVSEAVDTRRYVPNFDKLTLPQANERLLANVGALPAADAAPVAVPQFVGQPLDAVQTGQTP